MKKRIVSMFLTVAFCLGLLPGAALASGTGAVSDDVEYTKYREDGSGSVYTVSADTCTIVEDYNNEEEPLVWGGGVYYVAEDTTITGKITITGDVSLIIADGAMLEINGGIVDESTDPDGYYAAEHSVDIYGQSEKGGYLTINGGAYDDNDVNYIYAIRAKNISIHGVEVDIDSDYRGLYARNGDIQIYNSSIVIDSPADAIDSAAASIGVYNSVLKLFASYGLAANNTVTLRSSTLLADVDADGIFALYEDVNIENSKVSIAANGNGIFATHSENSEITVTDNSMVCIFANANTDRDDVYAVRAPGFTVDSGLNILWPEDGTADDVKNVAAELIIEPEGVTHTWAEDYEYDDTHHWHSKTDGMLAILPVRAMERFEGAAYATHNTIGANGTCSVCGYDPEAAVVIAVGGVLMQKGDYLPSGADQVTDTKPAEGGYAHYADGILTLNNYEYKGAGWEYDSYGDEEYTNHLFSMLYVEQRDIQLVLEGSSSISYAEPDLAGEDDWNVDGLCVRSGNVEICGSGSLVINADDDGIYCEYGDVTVSGGSVTIDSAYGIYCFSDVTVSGGSIAITSDMEGIWCEEDLAVSGGSIAIKSDEEGIWCNGKLIVSGGLVDVADREYGAIFVEELTLENNIELLLPEGGGVYYDEEWGMYTIADSEDNVASKVLFAPKTEHTWSEGYAISATHHWHLCTDEDCFVNRYPQLCKGYEGHSTEGVCKCGYDVNKKADVYVGGMGLDKGEYLSSVGVLSETKPAKGGYAHYADGKLTLHDYSYEGAGYTIAWEDTYVDENGELVPYTNYWDALIYVLKDMELVLEGDSDLSYTGSNGNDGITVSSGCDLTISGTGALTASAEYDGIYCEGDLTIKGGTLNLTAEDDAIDCDEGDVTIKGGTLNLVSDDDEGIDVYGGNLIMTGGVVNIVSDDHGIEVDNSEENPDKGNANISGGTITIRAGDEGIDAEGNVDISGGTITIDADGMAIDSTGTVNISGGELELTGRNDNAIETNLSCFITGGKVTARSVGNTLEVYGRRTYDDDGKLLSVEGGDLHIEGGEVELISTNGAAVFAVGTIYLADDMEIVMPEEAEIISGVRVVDDYGNSVPYQSICGKDNSDDHVIIKSVETDDEDNTGTGGNDDVGDPSVPDEDPDDDSGDDSDDDSGDDSDDDSTGNDGSSSDGSSSDGSSSRPSSGSSGSVTVSTTQKNEDGSTTVTTINKTTGTVTQTTTTPNGVSATVVTDKNGEVTTITAKVPAAAAEENEVVLLPVTVEQDTTMKITVAEKAGEVVVEIPVENMTPGIVAVLVDEKGNETVVSTTGLTDTGVVVSVTGTVTVKVVDNAADFSDVKDNSWFKAAADFASSRGMMNGVGEGRFGHEVYTTRAMVAQILHNLEGNPDHNSTVTFDDVEDHHWFADAIHWAAEEGILAGDGTGKVNPDQYVTREQLAVILWNYADQAHSDHSVEHFTDDHHISGYAETALRWAVEHSLMSGRTDGSLDPKGYATRAEVASVMMMFFKNVLY